MGEIGSSLTEHHRALTIDTQRRVERREEALESTLRVETTDSLQAFTHRGDTNGNQRVGIGLGCSGGSDVHRERRLIKGLCRQGLLFCECIRFDLSTISALISKVRSLDEPDRHLTD